MASKDDSGSKPSAPGGSRIPFRKPSPDLGSAIRSVERFSERWRAKRDERRREAADHARPTDGGERRPFAFLHFPKSAGSSVISSLHAGMTDHDWAPWEFDEELFGPYRGVPVPESLANRILPSSESLQFFDAAAGHLSLPTFLTRFEPVDVAVVLREPRCRLLSHYQYWRYLSDEVHDAHLPWTSQRSAVEQNFAEWLNDPSIAYQTDNLMIRQLVPDDRAIPADDFIAADQLSRLARRAVAALRDVGWVGLVEQGDATWVSLGKRTGVELRRERRNVTERRPELPTDLQAILSERGIRSLAARTAGDAVVWAATARRLDEKNPPLLADIAWHRRLAAVVRDEAGA